MKAQTKRCLELLDRVSEFFSEHATLTFGTRGTALVDQVDTTRDTMRFQGATQVSGRGEFHGGVAERRELAVELLAQIREIEMAAEAMDPATAPLPAEQLQRPPSRSLQALLDTAGAFITVLTPPPVQQAFIDRDFPATFVADLSTLAAQFAEATGRKYAGRQALKSGTLGVDQAAGKGLAIVKELNAIVTKKLRKTDPVLLGVWQTASRLEQPPRRSSTQPTEPTAPAPTAPRADLSSAGTVNRKESEPDGHKKRRLASEVFTLNSQPSIVPIAPWTSR
jgi:hypothetical protein